MAEPKTAVPVPDAVAERILNDRNVWLCTLRRDGSAHLTPVWFVHLRERWWISVEARSVKAGNLAADPRVSLALEDGDAPVVAEGRALVHTEGFPEDVVTVFQDKYGYEIRTPLSKSGGPRALLEVEVVRWLLSGTAQ